MSSLTYPFGLDISSWMGAIDFECIAKQAKPKVEWIGIRAAVSWGYKDPRFDEYWSKAKSAGLARTAYHVFYPLEDVKRQVDWFASILKDDLGELPVVADVELVHGANPATFQMKLRAYLIYLETVFGKKPIVYTRGQFLDDYITGKGKTPPAWLNLYDYWLAHYLTTGAEFVGLPRLPRGVERQRVIICQTSKVGQAFCMESKGTDYNRWQEETAYMKWRDYKALHTVKPVVVPEPTDWEKLIKSAGQMKKSTVDFVADLIEFGKNAKIQ